MGTARRTPTSVDVAQLDGVFLALFEPGRLDFPIVIGPFSALEK